MLRPDQDAMGHALLDALDGRPKTMVIERDDGMAEADFPTTLYLAPYDQWHDNERAAMERVRGRVLDMGVGAGRHALYLQEQGHEVVGIDISPGALEVCRRRGLRHVRLVSARNVGVKLGTFDTIIMMGNNFGLMESRERARRLLYRLARLTSLDSHIIAATLNIYATTDPDHLAYHERNRQRGRMAGQIRLRLRYRTLRSPWFNYLMVSPDELRQLAEGTPWRVEELIGDPEQGLYIAVLGKEAHEETVP
jgi:SAM-dependent methyltransferase